MKSQSAKPLIAAILPRGEAVRNFVYSGCLEEIAKNAKLEVLSVIPNEECRKLFESCYGGVHELKEFPENWPVRFLREILDLAHGKWLWSEAARERWRLRDLETNTFSKWVARSIKKGLAVPFSNSSGLNFLSALERSASRFLKTTDHYVKLYKKIKPSLVFNGSHIHSRSGIQAVQAAQWLGIPTAAFIFSWDNLTSQGRLIPSYDYYLVWNESIKSQLLKIYDFVRPDQVFVTGTPQFDFHFRPEFYWSREEFCIRVGADPARPIVLYTTGMANHMPGEPEIVEGIAKILREMKELGSPQLLVRIYPKDQTGRFDDLKERYPDILFPTVPWEANYQTPKPEDTYLLINTLRHCALGINVASTISLELCMFDKPVINVAYNPPSLNTHELDYGRYYQFDHYRPIIESGAIGLARSVESMTANIRNALQNPNRQSPARQQLIKNFFGNLLDGHSCDRIAKVLNAIHVKTPLFSSAKIPTGVSN